MIIGINYVMDVILISFLSIIPTYQYFKFVCMVVVLLVDGPRPDLLINKKLGTTSTTPTTSTTIIILLVLFIISNIEFYFLFQKYNFFIFQFYFHFLEPKNNRKNAKHF
jgi:hypothetical protein